MAENNFSNSNRHHGRRNRNNPHDAHSDDVNSHVSEPAPRAGKRSHHKKEENPHQERTTKMSKRTTRVISSVAGSIAFIFTLTVNGFGFEYRNPRPDDNRVNARPEVLRTAFDADKNDADFNREEFRVTNRDGSNFDRPRVDDFAFRGDTRNDSRALETFSYRVQEREINNRPEDRPDSASRTTDIDRPDVRFDGRRDDERGELRFGDRREFRIETDLDLNKDGEARAGRNNA